MKKTMDYKEKLLQNVHENIELPTTNGLTTMMKGVCHYYHYGCDGLNDKGWGCGYRTLQTLCSWVKMIKKHSTPVPSIHTIQNVLIQLEDKPSDFLGSRDWIGSFEDPHFSGRASSSQELQKNGWVKWQHIEDFVYSSFYNICLPQLMYPSS